MDLDVSRIEEKYILTQGQALSLHRKLRYILPGDAFNGNRPYFVRSLYFDSYWNDDYFDKLDGAQFRKKIRLRIYSPDDCKVKLEVKQKDGNSQRKRSLQITREEAEALIRGRTDILLHMDDPLAGELYYIFLKEQYKPRCIVEYRRCAFQAPVNNIRITFDSDITASEGNFDLFSRSKGAFAPVTGKNSVVLEVKYNHFLLSYIKDALSVCDVPKEACSKYVAGRYYGL